MKPNIRIKFMIVAVIFSQSAVAQNESIPFYGVTIESQDIFGKKQPFALAPRRGAIKTMAIQKAPVANDLYEYLGGVYTIKGFDGIPSQLLNLSLDDYTPILDSIDHQYYKAKGLRILADQLPGNPQIESLTKSLRAAGSSREAKDIIISLPTDIRQRLERTKFQIVSDSVTYSKAVSISRAFGVALGAKVVAQLKEIVDLDADASAVIEDSVSRIMSVKDAEYYQIALNEIYVTVAKQILSSWVNKKAQLESSPDIYFAPSLRDFFENPDAAIIVQAAIVRANFDRPGIKRVETALKALLKGSLDSGKLTEKKIAELAAEIGGKFGKQREGSINISTGTAYYYIKYCANEALELGAGAGRKSPGEKY